jgi:hypothetical protein
MNKFKALVILVLGVAYFLEPMTANSQKRRFSYRSVKTYAYGGQAGLTFSSFNPQHDNASSFSTGYYGGGFFEYRLPISVGVRAEVNFTSLRGSGVPYSLVFSPSSSFLADVKSMNLNIYGVEIPIMAKYTLPGSSPEIYVAGGFSGFYNLKTQAALYRTGTSSSVYNSSTLYVDVTDKVQKMMASGVISVGSSISMGSFNLLVNASVNLGITDLSSNNVVLNNGFRANYFKLGVGIGF